MKNMQIRFWDKDSCSYEYFKTEKTDTQEIREKAINTINYIYWKRWIKTSPFSLWLYKYPSFLVREYDNKIRWNPKWWIEFIVKGNEL